MRAKESGFSLIEIMIAMGLLGVMAVFIASITKMGQSGQKSVIAMDDARNLTNEMATLLMNSTACLNTFGGRDPVTGGGAGITAVRNAANTAVYQANTVYGNKALRFSGMNLGGAGVQPKMNLQRYTANSATQGTALAEVNWAKTADATGAAVLSRFFYVSVTLDGTNRIIACNATGGLAGDIWKRSPTDSNRIYYNEGNVGVGVTDAASKLEVAGGVKLANDSGICNAAKEGTQRYNSTTKVMEFCNGTVWASIGGSSILSKGTRTAGGAFSNVASVTISSPGILILSGWVSGYYNGGWPTNAGVTAHAYVDGNNCAQGFTFEGESSLVTFSTSVSCVVPLAAGTHTLNLTNSANNTTSTTNTMSWVIIRE